METLQARSKLFLGHGEDVRKSNRQHQQPRQPGVNPTKGKKLDNSVLQVKTNHQLWFRLSASP
jgi:hypothetical protein